MTKNYLLYNIILPYPIVKRYIKKLTKKISSLRHKKKPLT